MNKLLSTPLAIALSGAFVVAVSLSSCATAPKQEAAAPQQNLTPEQEAAARAAVEKKKAAERNKARQLQNSVPSGGCSH